MISIQNILTGWGFMRIFRLGLAIFIGMQAFQTQDAFAGMIAAFFLFQVVTNTGCCAGGVCNNSTHSHPTNEEESLVFEEVKTK